jgi:hypothetical protein
MAATVCVPQFPMTSAGCRPFRDTAGREALGGRSGIGGQGQVQEA